MGTYTHALGEERRVLSCSERWRGKSWKEKSFYRSMHHCVRLRCYNERKFRIQAWVQGDGRRARGSLAVPMGGQLNNTFSVRTEDNDTIHCSLHVIFLPDLWTFSGQHLLMSVATNSLVSTTILLLSYIDTGVPYYIHEMVCACSIECSYCPTVQ